MTTLQHDRVLTWEGPASLATRGTVVVVPGRGESPDVYERFGRRLASDAYRTHAVLAPTRGSRETLDQIDALAADAESGAPLVLVGSDAGAAFAARLVADRRVPGVTALVLAGLPTGAGAPPARDWDGELDLRTACPTHRARISNAGVTGAELFLDVPTDWVDPQIPSRLAVPVLGVHGRDDELSPVAAARHWYAEAPHAELVTLAGGRHDILNDQTHRTVAASVVLFLERVRGGPDVAPIAAFEQLGEHVRAERVDAR